MPFLKDFDCFLKRKTLIALLSKDFTPATGIEPAIRRFQRNSPQIGLNTIHFSHLSSNNTRFGASPIQCKVSATPYTQSYQGVPREDHVFGETFLRIEEI